MRPSLQWDMYTHTEHNLELVLLMLDSLHAQAGRVAHNTENSGNRFFYLCLFYLVLVLIAFLDFDVGIFKTTGLQDGRNVINLYISLK